MKQDISYSYSLPGNRFKQDEHYIECATERAKRVYSYNYSRLLPRSKAALIVDLGCGRGKMIEWLAEQGYQNLRGVDTDQFAVGHARQMLKGLIPSEHLICKDILELVCDCADESVDLFLMANTIEHLSKPYLLELVPEILRALKPGGAFIAQTGNIENPFNIGLFARDFTHEIMFTVNSLGQLMIMSGFDHDMVEVRTIKTKVTWRNWPLKITRAVMSWTIKMIALAMFIRIREMAPMIYCVARKKGYENGR